MAAPRMSRLEQAALVAVLAAIAFTVFAAVETYLGTNEYIEWCEKHMGGRYENVHGTAMCLTNDGRIINVWG